MTSSSLILLYIKNKDSFKSSPITLIWKISLMSPWGSLALFFFNDFNTWFNFPPVKSDDFSLEHLSILMVHKYSFRLFSSWNSFLIFLCLSLLTAFHFDFSWQLLDLFFLMEIIFLQPPHSISIDRSWCVRHGAKVFTNF